MAATRPTQERTIASVMSALESAAVDTGAFDELEPVKLAKPEPKTLAAEDTAHAEIKSIEDNLYRRSLKVVLGVMDFANIGPEDTEPPAAWIEQLGYEEALQRFRLAQAGQMGPKTAPVAIKAATSLVAAIAKVRAMEKTSGPKTLAISFVQLSAPLPEFPRRIVDTNK
jgi:hypothetical protein